MADSDVEKIKDRLSIVEVVGQYVQLKKAGRNFSARCPFHSERTPSFNVSPERGTYMCFGCGEKGDIFSFVEKFEGVDFRAALEQLAQKAGVVLEHKSSRDVISGNKEKERVERLKKVCGAAASFFQSVLAGRKDIQDYLRTRGVEAETNKHWLLGYAPASWDELCRHLVSTGFAKDDIVDAGLAVKSDKRPNEIFDRFRGRVMFPLFDAGGRVIAFSGRFFEKVPGQTMDGEPAKYVNSPETLLFKKSKVLYGLNFAKAAIRKAGCILLVEGQFDVVMSHQSGLPFTVAISGTALTQEHLSLLGRLSKRLVLALDADAAGVRAGLKSAAMALSAGFDVKVPTFLEGKDPADLARENPELLKAAVRTSKTAIEFFLDVTRLHAKDERVYKKLVELQVLPLLAVVQSKIEQEHFVRIVANKLGVSEAAVRAEVAKRPSLLVYEDAELESRSYTQEVLPALQKLAGMLVYHFGTSSPVVEQLRRIVGAEKLEVWEKSLEPHAEVLRFAFDAEVGQGEPESVARDILEHVERLFLDEEMLSAGGDAKKVQELARRRQELRK